MPMTCPAAMAANRRRRSRVLRRGSSTQTSNSRWSPSQDRAQSDDRRLDRLSGGSSCACWSQRRSRPVSPAAGDSARCTNQLHRRAFALGSPRSRRSPRPLHQPDPLIRSAPSVAVVQVRSGVSSDAIGFLTSASRSAAGIDPRGSALVSEAGQPGICQRRRRDVHPHHEPVALRRAVISTRCSTGTSSRTPRPTATRGADASPALICGHYRSPPRSSATAARLAAALIAVEWRARVSERIFHQPARERPLCRPRPHSVRIKAVTTTEVAEILIQTRLPPHRRQTENSSSPQRRWRCLGHGFPLNPIATFDHGVRVVGMPTRSSRPVEGRADISWLTLSPLRCRLTAAAGNEVGSSPATVGSSIESRRKMLRAGVPSTSR
jgi:hypothetical protein